MMALVGLLIWGVTNFDLVEIVKRDSVFTELDVWLGKKDKVNSQQMERHFWRKRAKAVGIDMLPPGRPSKERLRKWQNDIVEAERVFANGIISNKQKSPD